MPMTINDFRRIALSFEGAEDSSHMGTADFRVGGRIFCTLSHAKNGYGNLMLKPEQQATAPTRQDLEQAGHGGGLSRGGQAVL